MSRFSYANITSTLALALVVGGGTAYAASLPPDSVGTEQLQQGAVTAPKIRKGAVTGGKVQDGSLGLAELSTTPLTDVVTRRVVFFFTASPGEDGTTRSRTVLCEEGETVLAGGYDVVKDQVYDGQPNTIVRASRPATSTGAAPDDGTATRGWFVAARRNIGTPESVISVWVMCGS